MHIFVAEVRDLEMQLCDLERSLDLKEKDIRDKENENDELHKEMEDVLGKNNQEMHLKQQQMDQLTQVNILWTCQDWDVKR